MSHDLRDTIATLDALLKTRAEKWGIEAPLLPAGASEAEIAAVEKAIGHGFPAELRAFLALRNGWPAFGDDEVEIFNLADYRAERHRDWMLEAAGVPSDEEIEAYLEGLDDDDPEDGEEEKENGAEEASSPGDFVIGFSEQSYRTLLLISGGMVVDLYVEDDNIRPSVEETHEALLEFLNAEVERLKAEVS